MSERHGDFLDRADRIRARAFGRVIVLAGCGHGTLVASPLRSMKQLAAMEAQTQRSRPALTFLSSNEGDEGRQRQAGEHDADNEHGKHILVHQG